MTERLSLRRRLANRRKRQPHPSPSTSRGNSSSRGSSKSKSTKSLTRCASAPAILGVVEESVSGVDRENLECDAGVLTRGTTGWDVLSTSAPSNRSQFLRNYEENRLYDKDAKVVVNVTVEGSAGPIRVMVRLGSNVDEMIKLVLGIYGKEGRRPKLDDRNVASFELHDSYFSLHCLGKSDLIGDVGSRTFYLRASKKELTPTPSESRLVKTEAIAIRTASTGPILDRAFLFLPGFISRRVCKFMRRTRKLWKILGCLQSA